MTICEWNQTNRRNPSFAIMQFHGMAKLNSVFIEGFDAGYEGLPLCRRKKKIVNQFVY